MQEWACFVDFTITKLPLFFLNLKFTVLSLAHYSYSDCHTCHKEDQRSVGPAFKDIAKRYPVNKVYIEMLAQKVIIGGSRNWGYAVMDPHPKLSLEDAKMMVTYILSMKK